MLNQHVNGPGHLEFPSLSVSILTILLAMVLSTVIALTCKFTFQKEYFPNKLFQALVSSSTIAAMVMMILGDNVAAGFAVPGAVFIIRYGALIRQPRNIILIFAALSIGIATGEYSYGIAISGTILFCYILFLLYYTPVESDQNK